MKKEEYASITVKIPKELHVECKVKMARTGDTFVDLVRKALRDYVDGKFEV